MEGGFEVVRGCAEVGWVEQDDHRVGGVRSLLSIRTALWLGNAVNLRVIEARFVHDAHSSGRNIKDMSNNLYTLGLARRKLTETNQSQGNES